MESFSHNEPAKYTRWNKIDEIGETEKLTGIGDLSSQRRSVFGFAADQSNDTSHEPEDIPGLDLGERYIAHMIKATREMLSKPREGYHVTDVAGSCPRKKVFSQIQPVTIDVKTVSILSAGKAIHGSVQWMFLSDEWMFEKEKHLEYHGIRGSVDLYDSKRKIPLEFKTSRASEIREPKSFHVEQLKYYMAILNVPTGYILYQLLMHFGNTPFRAFKITMNAQERKNQRNKLVKEVASLKRAIEERDPSLAKPVINDPALNWLCRDCQYQSKCKGMQDAAAAA